jgi:hypothetical protein
MEMTGTQEMWVWIIGIIVLGEVIIRVFGKRDD